MNTKIIDKDYVIRTIGIMFGMNWITVVAGVVYSMYQMDRAYEMFYLAEVSDDYPGLHKWSLAAIKALNTYKITEDMGYATKHDHKYIVIRDIVRCYNSSGNLIWTSRRGSRYGTRPYTRKNFYNDGTLKTKAHYRYGKLSNEDWEEPTVQKWYNDGSVKAMLWHAFGKLDRTNKPAMRKWHNNGNKKAEGYYHAGHLATDVPISYKEWHSIGVIKELVKMTEQGTHCPHYIRERWNEAGALVLQETLLANFLQSNDGNPSHRSWYDSGLKKVHKWHSSNELHNTTGPAVLQWSDSLSQKLLLQAWYINNEKHRDEGPAEIKIIQDPSSTVWSYYTEGNLIKKVSLADDYINDTDVML